MRYTLAHSVLATALLIVAARPAAAACVGDCGQDGQVTVSDLITMLNIDLGSLEISACTAGDAGNDGTIDITDIVNGVNNALVGCGGSPTPTATPGGSGSYVGDYSGKAGIYGVRFHVAANGSANGFLDFLGGGASVAGAGGAAGNILFSYAASGQANLATGAYQLAGSVFPGNDFSFSGQLPASSNAPGTLSVTVFGETSEGTLSAGTGPPPATPTPTPGCDSADLQMSFSDVSANFNGNASSFAVTRMILAIEQKAPDYFPEFHEVYNSTFDGTDCTQPRSVHIGIFEVPGGLGAGQSFPISLSGSSGEAGAMVFYGQTGGGDRVWYASAGTVFVDAVDGSVVTLRVVGAAMTDTAGAAAGSFTLDVSGPVNTFTRQP